jgi:twinkle protein
MHDTESQLVSKGPCGDCGSSDACATYDDGHTYCYSCETHTKGDTTVSQTVELTTDGELGRITQQWQKASPKAMPERALQSGPVSKYNVLVTDTHHYYPYFAEDQADPVAFKVRNIKDKTFRVVGQLKDAGLFGQHRYGAGRQDKIVIVEGECDAIAAAALLNQDTPVVSLKGGAAATGRDIKASYEFLDGFKEIVLCMDADDAGKAGIEKAAEIFAGKLRIVKLNPQLGKDPNDYLKAGLQSEFVEAVVTASPFVPKGIVGKDELWSRLNSERPEAIGMYPWDKLNSLTYGFRPTELVTITAGSGLGKSSILRELIVHLKNTTPHRIGTLFLEESVERTAEGFMSVDLSTPVHLPSSSVKRGDSEYKASFDRMFGDDRLVIMDAAFDTGATVEQIIARVRYLIKAMDCKVSCWITSPSWCQRDSMATSARHWMRSCLRLRALTQDTGVTLFAVSHLKRPEGKGHEEGAASSLSQLRGSASIAQLSDFVIGLERNAQSEDEIERCTTKVRVLKNRFSGITGPAGALLYNTETGRLSEYDPEEAAEEAL